MAQTVDGGPVKIIVSGSHQDAPVNYAQKLIDTDAWVDRSIVITGHGFHHGFHNVVVTDNPNDTPASSLISIYSVLYNNATTTRQKRVGVANDQSGATSRPVGRPRGTGLPSPRLLGSRAGPRGGGGHCTAAGDASAGRHRHQPALGDRFPLESHRETCRGGRA